MAERLRRYVQVVVNFVGVGLIPTGRTFLLPIHVTDGENCEKYLTPEGIEPPIFGSGIRRVAIAPWSQRRFTVDGVIIQTRFK